LSAFQTRSANKLCGFVFSFVILDRVKKFSLVIRAEVLLCPLFYFVGLDDSRRNTGAKDA